MAKDMIKFIWMLLLLSQVGMADDESEPIHLDIRLMAADLVDELVFGWGKKPPFETRKAVSLANVIAPIGLDERLTVFTENRLFELLRVNPQVNIDLAHCSVCTRLVVKSTPKETLISRGIDQPEVLSGLLRATPDQLGLILAFEAEGKELVLRAKIFELKGRQKIVWAQSYATSMSSRRLLREASPLISLEEARRQQQELLERRDPIEMVTRFSIRQFFLSSEAGLGGALESAPLIFLEQTFDGVLLPNRAQRLGITVGFTSIKDALTAYSVGGQYMTLLNRETPSLSQADLYFFAGFHYVRMRGPAALPFGEKELNIDEIVNTTTEPKATIVTWRMGLETHLKHRYGGFVFLEYVPLLKDVESFEQRQFAFIPYHNLGLGMVMRW